MKTAKATLIEAAETLRRKVRKSLPWGMRLASVLFHLRLAADAATFGRFAYGVMLTLGVEGLPRTSFVPSTIREIDRLPQDYGLEFAHRAQYIARKYLHNDDDVEEVLSLVALKLISNQALRNNIRGKNIRDAQNYTLRTVQNLAIDFLRAQQSRRHEEISDIIREPGSWENLGDLIPEREQEQIKKELEESVGVHQIPDLPLYLDLLMDGYSNKEIAENRLLPSLKDKPISQQALAKRYRDKIKSVLREHFQVQAGAARWKTQAQGA